MGAHVFLVGEDNFPICVRRGVYGSVYNQNERVRAEIIAGALSVRVGDLVFFHVNNVGVHGLWKATTPPFFDTQPLWPSSEQRYPYRFCFEPIIRHFARHVSFMDALDLKDKGKLWSYDLGTKVQKNHYAITSTEARELIRLLLRNNPVALPVQPVLDQYEPPADFVAVEPEPETDESGRFRFEGALSAFLTRQFIGGDFRDIFGEYEDVLNFVPTTFNKVMDLFLTHVTNLDGVNILHKFTCIELKSGRASEDDLSQLLRYENWLVRKLAGGEGGMVQSVLIAHSFMDEVLRYVLSRRSIEERTVGLFKYQLDKRRRRVELKEVTE